jgi:hypothetical protein
MGWKSTLEITRQDAINAILKSLEGKTPYDDMSNKELEMMMYERNIGDDLKLPYFGYNFTIKDTEEELYNP